VEQEIVERRRSVGSHASPDFSKRKLGEPERISFVPPQAGFGESPPTGEDSGEGSEESEDGIERFLL
jgi:hypothetical protein